MWSPGNVTFHPMRDYAEWKNILPIAADVVGARRNCSVFLRKTFALGAGTSSFPQNALRWRFVGVLGNLHFETDIRRAPTKAKLLWDIGRTDLKANFGHLLK